MGVAGHAEMHPTVPVRRLRQAGECRVPMRLQPAGVLPRSAQVSEAWLWSPASPQTDLQASEASWQLFSWFNSRFCGAASIRGPAPPHAVANESAKRGNRLVPILRCGVNLRQASNPDNAPHEGGPARRTVRFGLRPDLALDGAPLGPCAATRGFLGGSAGTLAWVLAVSASWPELRTGSDENPVGRKSAEWRRIRRQIGADGGRCWDMVQNSAAETAADGAVACSRRPGLGGPGGDNPKTAP
jgi:hypothetical protein